MIKIASTPRRSLLLRCLPSLPKVFFCLGALVALSAIGRVPRPYRRWRRPCEERECVRCDMLFSKLGPSSTLGKRSQYVEAQLRGEAKSGTSMMHEWASGALYHFCDYLKESFGDGACRMSWTSETPEDAQKGKFTNRTLVFDPQRGDTNAKCSCDSVDRVVISVSKRNKHTLPVEPTCKWWHPNTIARPSHEGVPCGARTYSELWACVRDEACVVNDDRLQFVVMRDPRPMAVSAYYHRLRGGQIKDETAREDYMRDLLTPICAWLVLRHILFTGLLQTRSTLFWYEDALAHPLDFHLRWMEFVGLRAPHFVIEEAVHAALTGDFDFFSKGIDVHPGGGDALLDRSWKHEVSSELAAEFDDIVGEWLPPALHAKVLRLDEAGT